MENRAEPCSSSGSCISDCFRTQCPGYETKEQERASHSEIERGISFEEWWADYDDFDCSQIKCNGNCNSSCQAVSKRAWEAALKNRRITSECS